MRKRLFITHGDGLLDYEILECLLFASIPRQDVKPLAKKLLQEYGGLWKLLSATPERLKASGLSEAVIGALLIVSTIALRAAKEEILDKDVFNSWQRIIDYLRMSIGHEAVEHVRVLFIDTKGRIIKDEIKEAGMPNRAPILIKEIVKKGVELNASSIVLAHNHPSGDVQPSKEDEEITKQLVQSCLAVDITVIDHMIMSSGSFFSFKHNGLL